VGREFGDGMPEESLTERDEPVEASSWIERTNRFAQALLFGAWRCGRRLE
jgi:hypothetical protein